MNRSLCVILTVLLILSIFVTGCDDNSWPYRIYPAHIKEVNIVTNTESLVPQYCLRVVAGGPTTCWEPWRYLVMRFGNMIFVEVLTLHDLRKACGFALTYVEKIIPLDSCLIPSKIYMVVVNGRSRLLVAGWWNGIKE